VPGGRILLAASGFLKRCHGERPPIRGRPRAGAAMFRGNTSQPPQRAGRQNTIKRLPSRNGQHWCSTTKRPRAGRTGLAATRSVMNDGQKGPSGLRLGFKTSGAVVQGTGGVR
jgi:hypothetical protein